ncbi:hypothetical protein [Yersinia hibernica]|uniref:hypothetical protein n=1 Tax=Yersinia hibernica TaxID=2339259 RepID=UPI0011AA175E|nr:hypothetical protein [Yersinia hibernica]
MMDTTTSREEFEAHLKTRYLNGRGHFDTWSERFVYTDSHIQAMWEGWQESRKSISVFLPKAALTREFSSETPEYRMMAFDVKEALRSAGLTVKGD